MRGCVPRVSVESILRGMGWGKRKEGYGIEMEGLEYR